MMANVDVLGHVRGYWIVREFDGAFVVLVNNGRAQLPVMDVHNELAAMDNALAALLGATYSVFVVERATTSCCIDVHLTAPPLRTTTSPD
jgi:hypothetical protein